MTQKELIDFCNTQPMLCFGGGCDNYNECMKYQKKHGTVPRADDEFHPERYTDEEI